MLVSDAALGEQSIDELGRAHARIRIRESQHRGYSRNHEHFHDGVLAQLALLSKLAPPDVRLDEDRGDEPLKTHRNNNR